ncbi:MAG: transporter substrate-binding domain-containing protein [Oscillospiraceae bacterium]|nr:transporter substrate-binding domain-containing protein [Oscillospiraceae bacterium]
MLSFIFGGCSQGADNSKFRVGLECAYAPFNWTQTDDSNGAVPIEGGGFAGGYDVEIAKLVAAGLNKELVIVKTEWDGLLPAVTSGKIDAIIAGMSPTADRKESIDFSDNYYYSDLVIVVMKDGPYAGAAGLGDFAGAMITGQLNTFHYSVIDQIPDVSMQTAMDDFPTMIVALTSGRIDGYVSERPGAISAAESNPNITFIEPNPGFQYEPDDAAIAIGLKQGSPLLSDINKVLGGVSIDERERLMGQALINQPNE